VNRREALALLMVLIIPGIFVVYEASALDAVVPWHTISFYAQHNLWVFWTVIAIAIAALIVFIYWWSRHMRSKIGR
jgi:cell division protein FtsW (lipid II flippase)